ncbi:MAG: type IV pilus biogenesis/stability protein PilW [Halieaceae bacterium]|nr:type IV pilus biogenesis/stability protein PilW [Halieaceae bacterium]
MKASHRRNTHLTWLRSGTCPLAWQVAATLVTVLLLSGCVTEYSGGAQMTADPDATLDKRVSLARQYIGVGDWDNAKRNLELAQEIDPQNAEVFEAFALVYQSTGEFELAEQQFKAALGAEPSLSRARNNYAAFLYSRGRFTEAESEFSRVTDDTLYSGRPMAFVNLGLCRLQLSDPVGAEAAFSRALSMDRRNSVALLEMGFLRLEAGDTDEAKRYHGTYRTVTPQQSPRGLLLGLRIADLTGDQDALGSYELALRNLYPDSAEYRAWRERQSR